jgi:hypothetical protein
LHGVILPLMLTSAGFCRGIFLCRIGSAN